MQPDQGHHPDYNFIMNPAAPPKRGLLKGGDKKQHRLMMFIGLGVAGLLIVMLMSVLFGGSSSNTDKLVSVAKKQTELIRVAAIADKKADGAEAKNLGVTTQLSLASAKKETTTLIAKQGRKVTDKQLASPNKDTDAALTTAEQTNRFDDAFLATMKTQLTAYQQELSDIYNASGDQAEKTLVQKLYNQAKQLLAAIK